MGWMMINGNYDTCLQKCKGHKHPGGEGWHGVTLKGFHMSKWITTMYFLMATLLAHAVSFEEKIRRHGGKHVVPHSCPEDSTTGKPFALDLCEDPSWIYVLQLHASFCRYDGYLITTFFCFLLKMLIQSNKLLVCNIKSKKYLRIYLNHGCLKIWLDKINDFWMENHKCHHAR